MATQAALTRVRRGARSVGVGPGADAGTASFDVWGREESGSVVTVCVPSNPVGSVGAYELRMATGRSGPDAARSTSDPIVSPTQSPCKGRRSLAVIGRVGPGRVLAHHPDPGDSCRTPPEDNAQSLHPVVDVPAPEQTIGQNLTRQLRVAAHIPFSPRDTHTSNIPRLGIGDTTVHAHP